MTFTQVDPTDYTTIVGRGWVRINDEPGRGLLLATVDNRAQPLEFHTGVPVRRRSGGGPLPRAGRAHGQGLGEPGGRESQAGRPAGQSGGAAGGGHRSANRPAGPRQGAGIRHGPAGHQRPGSPGDPGRVPGQGAALAGDGPAASPARPPRCARWCWGWPTATRPSRWPWCWWILRTPPGASTAWAAGDGNTLDKLPHVLATVSTANELDRVVKRLVAEFDDNVRGRLKGHPKVFTPQDNQKRSIFVIIDHYDDAAILNRAGVGLMGLAEVGKGKNLNLVVAGTTNITRDSSDELRRRAEFLPLLADPVGRRDRALHGRARQLQHQEGDAARPGLPGQGGRRLPGAGLPALPGRQRRVRSAGSDDRGHPQEVPRAGGLELQGGRFGARWRPPSAVWRRWPPSRWPA